MDFNLPPEAEETKKKIREFIKENITEEISEKYDSQEIYPREVSKKMFEKGLIRLDNPWGTLIMIEELCRVDPGLGFAATGTTFGAEAYVLFGSDEHRKKYLEPLLRGEKINAVAVTEPGAGSDVAGITSRLEQTPDGNYILNGSKMFITNGTVADFFIVVARTSPPPSPQKRHLGLTMAVVEASWPGVSTTKLKGKMGIRATDTAEVKFENVKVPKENIIGEAGKAFYYIMTFFDLSRVYIAAQSVGIAQGALDEFFKYVKETGSTQESVQFALAEAAARVEAARLLTYKAANLVFQFNPDPALSAMAKYYTAEVASFVVETAMEHVGYRGIISKLERLYRDQKITEIYEGTSEIEKLTIARFLLKKESLV